MQYKHTILMLLVFCFLFFSFSATALAGDNQEDAIKIVQHNKNIVGESEIPVVFCICNISFGS